MLISERRRDRRQPASVPGDNTNPPGRALLEAKFRDCVSFSKRPVSAKNVDAAIKLLHNLETVDNVTEIVRLLVPR